MKKSLLLMLLFAVLCSNNTNAQIISKEVLSKYPPSIVVQVYDLAAKTKIDDETQVAVADILVEKEKTIFTMLAKGQKDAEIKAVKIEFDDKISTFLTSEQKYFNYVQTKKAMAKDKFSYSQFAIAIRFKDSLGVSKEQEDALLAQVIALKALKNEYYEKKKKGMDSRGYESENIAKILSNVQYNSLLYIKNRSKAESFAENDWKEIVQRGLEANFKKETVLAELIKFYTIRESIYNKYYHDLIKQKVEIRAVYNSKPDVLRILEKVRRNPDNDTATKLYKW